MENQETSEVIEWCCGLLLRRRLRAELERGAVLCDVRLAITENRGWIDSSYTARVTGKALNVKAFLHAARDYFLESEALQ